MNHLTTIISAKHAEVTSIKGSWENFRSLFSQKTASIIGEVKPFSPNNPSIWNAEELIAKCCADARIKAISVLIDEAKFWWDVRRINKIRAQSDKPVLYKEFVIDKKQIDQAASFWYDAVLLIYRVFNQSNLSKIYGGSSDYMKELMQYCRDRGIEPVVEFDDADDVNSFLKSTTDRNFTIWINCRNLDTMEIDRRKHFEILERIEEDTSKLRIIAFSWIEKNEQVEEYVGKYDGVLIWSNILNF